MPRNKKHYRRLSPDPSLEAGAPTGPSLSRGWIKFRSPLSHPAAALDFLARWRRLKRELDAAPGLLWFEYRAQLTPTLMVGLHVLWDDPRSEQRFVKDSSHREFATWSLKAAFTPALRLEHFTAKDGRLVRFGGFYAFERDDDLPEDSCQPIPCPAAKR